jgi:hypothetical protein
MINIRNTIISSMLICCVSQSVMAANVAAAFSQGSRHLSVIAGSGYAFNNNYFVFGLGASYYVTDGLSLGLFAETWRSGEPGINKITPSIEYVFYQLPSMLPYIGAYYRRTYIDNLPDLDSAAGRAGVYIFAGDNVYVGMGGVYESYLDCDESVFVNCSDTYPEISVTVAF